jgi:hypothetical protein
MRWTLFLAIALSLVSCQSPKAAPHPQPKSEITASPTPSPSESPLAIADSYLEDLKKGGDGAKFWCPDAKPEKLYAVRGYKRLGDQPFANGKGTIYRVQVESSTKGGNPVVANWDIAAEKRSGGDCIGMLRQQK